MHEVIIYTDQHGKSPIESYLKELQASNSKASKVQLNKINDYIQALQEYGTRLPENYLKHLDGDIWELRPRRDRILFAALIDGKYILLHQFMKKTQKTPKAEIEKAKRELEDYRKNI